MRFSTPLDDKNGLWLSLVERLVRDQEAVGSNPTSPISNRKSEALTSKSETKHEAKTHLFELFVLNRTAVPPLNFPIRIYFEIRISDFELFMICPSEFGGVPT